MTDEKSRVRIRVAAGLIVLLLFSVSASTGPGVTWDETAYVASGYSYYNWQAERTVNSLSKSEIDRYWQVNHEHPPLAKIIYGIAAAIEGGETLRSILTARLFAAAMFTLLVLLIYIYVTKNFGGLAGGLAAASFVLMPRIFGHGHLAALDMPAALTIFAATIAFVESRYSKSQAALAGLIFGLALLTKLNAIFLPFVLVPWAIWYWRKEAASKIAIFLLVGGITFFVGWPWLWPQPKTRIVEYITNKTERLEEQGTERLTVTLPVYYLGKYYGDGEQYESQRAPWHYPFVMTLVTVPLGLLILAGLGGRDAVKIPTEEQHSRQRGTGVLLIASAVVPMLVIALPMVPKYDGVRLFLPAFPFIACLSGAGAAWLIARGRKFAVILGVYGAVLAGILIYTHPYELSYYSPVVGGAWGANKIGFETTYWGDTVTREVVEFINNELPLNSSVGFRPPHLTFLPWGREDIQLVEEGPQFIIEFRRQGMLGDKDYIDSRETIIKEWKYMGVPQTILLERDVFIH